jgi:hypothetical protein
LSLKTVTVTGSDVNSNPSKLRPTAVSVCEPLFIGTEFHGVEYGAEVSGAPTLTPSTLNWTLPTVRPPMIVTLAVIGVVPLTVAPALGEVMLTVKLPSCAESVGARNQIDPMMSRKTLARRALLATLECLRGKRDPAGNENI